MKIVIGSMLLVAGLCSAGCGIVDDAQDGPSESTATDESIVWCTNKAWRVDFYAEPAHTNLVGWLKCDCYQPQTRSGTTSNYTNLAYEFNCDLQ